MEPTEQAAPARAGTVTRVIRAFEHVVVLILMGLLMVVTAVLTFELVWILIGDLSAGTLLPLDMEDTFEVFGYFLLVLIGMELLSTLKAYLYERVIHVEIVLEVALIAMAQKVIILDTARSDGVSLLGLAGLVAALTAAFWGVRTARRARTDTTDRGPGAS